MILKTLDWLTKSLDRVEDMERRLRRVDDLVRGADGLEYRIDRLEIGQLESECRLNGISDALDEAGEDDAVPRVSVVDAAATLNVAVCAFCASPTKRISEDPCKSCSMYQKALAPDELPLNFKLREDIR